MTRRFCAVVSILCVSCSAGSDAPSDRLVDIGSHRLEVRIEGEGAPVVVIDTGVADTMDSWLPLQRRLSRSVRVVAYNRAGYGKSEAGPLPRDAGREADELKALLEKAAVPGPYVLVGHSLGALNVQMFASKYPADTAGLVLLDPPPLPFMLGLDYKELLGMAERTTAEWQAVADAEVEPGGAGGKTRAAFYRMIASEHREMLGGTPKQVDGIESFGGIPVLVMAAGKPNPAFGAVAGEYQRYWIEQSRLLAGKSAKSRFVLAETASHALHLDAPDLVVESILSVVQESRLRP